MKWWNEQAWPWLKKNWWWLPVFPVVGLVLLVRALGGQKTVIIDPVAKADERAKAEEEIRETITLEERNRLELELAMAHKDHDEKRTEFETAQASQTEELQNSPDKLRDLMIETGKPR